MTAFLDVQQVYTIQAHVRQTRLHGIGSYDGTKLYIIQNAESHTVPHELEHIIRRFVETSITKKAALVSPQQDPTLQIDGHQCEAGFVSEHLNGHKFPQELITPFSATVCV